MSFDELASNPPSEEELEEEDSDDGIYISKSQSKDEILAYLHEECEAKEVS